MGNKLLIRAYNVGCGDCFYVRIPNKGDGFHILIDCGKKGGAEPLLKQAIDHLRDTMLPKGKAPGMKRLDLIVATHRHEDHIKGFDPGWFKKIEVKNVWLSAVMNPDHPQAERVRKLHDYARTQMRGLMESGLALSPEAEMLASLYSVSNDVADDFLMKTLKDKFGTEPKYVHAGMTHKDLGMKLDGALIRVLAPEEDIDGYYLGKVDASLKGLQEGAGVFMDHSLPVADSVPVNISAADFRLLQSRLLSNALGFAEKDTTIQNNMSVVLLIEWQKRRLLFVGDAEWAGPYKKGKQNGSWNVMWENRKEHLNKPVDFLKIGHHGSFNATPWAPEVVVETSAAGKKKQKPGAARAAGRPAICEILDALLPVPAKGKPATALAIVSTEREFYPTIPDGELLVELGKRVSGTRDYSELLHGVKKNPESLWVTTKAKKHRFFESYERDFLDKHQPPRTDLEFAVTGQPFIEVEIGPKR